MCDIRGLELSKGNSIVSPPHSELRASGGDEVATHIAAFFLVFGYIGNKDNDICTMEVSQTQYCSYKQGLLLTAANQRHLAKAA